MNTVTFKGREFQNWRDFFSWLFSKDGLFDPPETARKNETNFETYRYKDKSCETEVLVAYLYNFSKLIYYYVLNPLTIGYTRFQKEGIQYFEQGQFDDPPTYGGAGLEFDLTNLENIAEEMSQGLNGKEIQYIKGHEVIKSEIIIPESVTPITFRFDKRKMSSRIREIFTRENRDPELMQRIIDLHEIFPGIT